MPLQIIKSPYKFSPAENPIIFTVTNSGGTPASNCINYEIENNAGGTGSTFSYRACITNALTTANVTGGVFACARPGTVQLVSGDITVSTFDANCGTIPAIPPITPIYYKVELFEANTNTLVYTGKLFPTPDNPTKASINLSQQLQALVRSDVDNSDTLLQGKPKNYLAYKVKFTDFGLTASTATTISALSTGITSNTFYVFESGLDILNFTNDWNSDDYVLQTGEEDKKFLTYYPREEEKCVNEYSNEQLYFIQDLGTGTTQFLTSILITTTGNTTILDFSGICITCGDNLTLTYRNACDGSSPLITGGTYTCVAGGAPPEYLAAVFAAQLDDVTIFPGKTIRREGTKVIITRNIGLGFANCPVQFNMTFTPGSHSFEHNESPIIPIYDIDLPGGGYVITYDGQSVQTVNEEYGEKVCQLATPEEQQDWKVNPSSVLSINVIGSGTTVTYESGCVDGDDYTQYTFNVAQIDNWQPNSFNDVLIGDLQPLQDSTEFILGMDRVTNNAYINRIVDIINNNTESPFGFNARKTSNKTLEIIMAPGLGSLMNGFEVQWIRTFEGCAIPGVGQTPETALELKTFEISCGRTYTGNTDDPKISIDFTNAQASTLWNIDESAGYSFGIEIFSPVANEQKNTFPFTRLRRGITRGDLFNNYYSQCENGGVDPATAIGFAKGMEWMINNTEYAFNIFGYDFTGYEGLNFRQPNGEMYGYRASAETTATGARLTVRLPKGIANLLYDRGNWNPGEWSLDYLEPEIYQETFSAGTVSGITTQITPTFPINEVINQIPVTQTLLTAGQTISSTVWSSTTYNDNFIITFDVPENRAEAVITITGTSAQGDNVCFNAVTTGGTTPIFCYTNSSSENSTTLIAQEMAGLFNLGFGDINGYTGQWNGDNTLSIFAPVGLGAEGNDITLSGAVDVTSLPNTLPALSPTTRISGILPAFAPGQTAFIEGIDYELGNLVFASYVTTSGDVSSVSTYVSNLVTEFNTNPYGYTASQVGSNVISFTARTGTGEFQNYYNISLSDGNGTNFGEWTGGTNSGSTSYENLKYSIQQFAGGSDFIPDVTGFTQDKIIRINVSPKYLQEQYGLGLQEGQKLQIQLYDVNDNPLTEVFTYKWCGAECNKDYVNILWTNSLGGVDSYQFTAPQETINSDKQSITKNNINLDNSTPYITNNVYNSADLIYSNKMKSSFTVWTQELSDGESDWLVELLKSKNVYVELSNLQFVPIKLRTTNYNVRKKKYNNRQPNQFQFTFEFDENYLPPTSVGGRLIIND